MDKAVKFIDLNKCYDISQWDELTEIKRLKKPLNNKPTKNDKK